MVDVAQQLLGDYPGEAAKPQEDSSPPAPTLTLANKEYPESNPVTKNPYDNYIVKIAEDFEIDPNHFKATIRQESGFKANATGPMTRYGRAKGLGQLIDSTAKAMGVTDPYDPIQNLIGSAKYLRMLYKRYNGDKRLVSAAYNAGLGNVDKYGGIPPFPETIDYVEKVSKYYEEYSGQSFIMAPNGEGGLTQLSSPADKGQDKGLLSDFLSLFVSTAHADDSPTKHVSQRKALKKDLIDAREYIKQKGGWDKLNEKQQQLISHKLEQYKKLDTKMEKMPEDVRKNVMSSFDPEKKGFNLKVPEEYENLIGNIVDLVVGPSNINSSILEAVGLKDQYPDINLDMIDATSGMKRSFVEKYIKTATFGFVDFNIEKPIDEQSWLERQSGMAGSVLGIVLGYASPLGGPGLLFKSAKALYPYSRLLSNMVGMYGLGAMEGLSHGKNPWKNAALYASFPLAFKVLGLGVGLAKHIKDARLANWVNKYFVPDKVAPAVDLAKKSKTFSEFVKAFKGMKEQAKAFGEFAKKNKKFASKDARVVLKSDLKKFYDLVKKGKMDSLVNELREFIFSVLNSKKQIKVANDLEKFIQSGGQVQEKYAGGFKMVGDTVKPVKEKVVRKFVKHVVDYFLRRTATVLKKFDPINGSRFQEAVDNYARQHRYILGSGKRLLDSIFHGVRKKRAYSDKEIEIATKMLEGLATKKELQSLGPRLTEVSILAHNLDRFLKVLGRKFVKLGAMKEASTIENVRAVQLMEKYFPHKFTDEQLYKFSQLDPKDVTKIAEFLVRTKQAPTFEAAKKMYTNYVNALAYNKPLIGKEGFEKARDLNIPGYRRDAGVFYDYLEKAAQRIAFIENFGKNGEKLIALGEKIKRHGGSTTFVNEAVNRILGVEPKTMWTEIFRRLRQINTFLFTPGTTALNLAQRNGIPIEAGMKAFGEGLVKKQANARLISKSGVMNNRILDDIKDMQVGGMRADDWLTKIQNKFLKLLGWKHVEVFNRADAASAGIERIRSLFNYLKGGTKDKEMIRMAKQLLGKNRYKSAMKRGYLNQQDLIYAGQTLERDTQFWYLATDLPLFFSQEAGKALTQFKASAYLYTMFLKEQVYEEAKRGNLKPLFYWMTIGAASNELVANARSLQSLEDPFDENNPYRPTAPGRRYVEDLLFEGQGLGVLSDALNALKYAKRGNAERIWEFLGGPSGKRLVDITGAMLDYYKTWGSKSAQDQLIRVGLQQIPGIGRSLSKILLPYEPKSRRSSSKSGESRYKNRREGR